MTPGVSPLLAQDHGNGDEHRTLELYSVFAAILTSGFLTFLHFMCKDYSCWICSSKSWFEGSVEVRSWTLCSVLVSSTV